MVDAALRPGHEAALKADLAKIVEMIPSRDLAINWDCSWGIADVYVGVPGVDRENAIERNRGQIRNLSWAIPAEVRLGMRVCFGTFGGWPRFAPDDLGAAARSFNAAMANAGRRFDWVHIPTLGRSDDAFFAPLAWLESRGREFISDPSITCPASRSAW